MRKRMMTNPIRAHTGLYRPAHSNVTLIVQPLGAHCCHIGTSIEHPVPDRVKQSFVIFDIQALDAQGWASSAWMSKITNDGLTQSGTRCFIAVPIWQQWVSKCQCKYSPLLICISPQCTHFMSELDGWRVLWHFEHAYSGQLAISFQSS